MGANAVADHATHGGTTNRTDGAAPGQYRARHRTYARASDGVLVTGGNPGTPAQDHQCRKNNRATDQICIWFHEGATSLVVFKTVSSRS